MSRFASSRTLSPDPLRPSPFLALVVAVLALLAGCGSSTSGTGAEGQSSLVFADGDPVLQVDTASFTSVPATMNYWSGRGLDVEVQPTKASAESIQLLSGGRADVALVGTTAFYQALKVDPSLRLLWFQKANIWRIGVPEGSPRRDLADLRGATIGVSALGTSGYLIARAAVQAAGLDPEKDVTWLPVGVAAQAAAALDSGQVDAYASYDGPFDIVGGVAAKPLTALPTALDRVHGTLAIATTQKTLDARRDDLVKFVQGFNEGAVFTATNPPAAMELHWRVHPDQRPPGDPAAAVEATLPSVSARYSHLADGADDGRLGQIDVADLQFGVDFLQRHGLIDEAVDAGALWDRGVTDSANAIDVASIRSQATSRSHS